MSGEVKAIRREFIDENVDGRGRPLRKRQLPPPQRRWPRSRDRGLVIFNPCFELGVPLIFLLDGHAQVECGQVHFIDENGGGAAAQNSAAKIDAEFTRFYCDFMFTVDPHQGNEAFYAKA